MRRGGVVPEIPRPQGVPSRTVLPPRDYRGGIAPNVSAVICERANLVLVWPLAAGGHSFPKIQPALASSFVAGPSENIYPVPIYPGIFNTRPGPTIPPSYKAHPAALHSFADKASLCVMLYYFDPGWLGSTDFCVDVAPCSRRDRKSALCSLMLSPTMSRAA